MDRLYQCARLRYRKAKEKTGTSEVQATQCIVKNFGFRRPFPVETTKRKTSGGREYHFDKYETQAKRDFKTLNRRLKQC